MRAAAALWLVLPLAAIALTAWLEVDLLRRTGYLPWLQPLVIAAALAALRVLVSLASALLLEARETLARDRRRSRSPSPRFLVAPAAWSATTLEAPVNGVFPGAGPNFVSGLAATQGARLRVRRRRRLRRPSRGARRAPAVRAGHGRRGGLPAGGGSRRRRRPGSAAAGSAAARARSPTSPPRSTLREDARRDERGSG